MNRNPILLFFLLLIKVLGSKPDKFYCDSTSHPTSIVNDNYCDCADQSDEPLTSACISKFTCQNKGFKVVEIPSMYVHDHICDCCDGSDEVNGTCPNVCATKAAEYNKEARIKNIAIKAGLKKKKELIEKAKVEIEKDRMAVKEMEKELEKLQAELEVEQAIEQAAEEDASETEEAETGESTETSDGKSEGSSESTDANTEQENDSNEYDNLPDPQFTFKDTYWQTVLSCFESSQSLYTCTRSLYLYSRKSLYSLIYPKKLTKPTKTSTKTTALNTKIDSLTEKLHTLRTNLEKPHGVQNVFYTLHEPVLFDTPEYTYKLIFGQSVSQDVKNGHSTVSLGNFKQFEGNVVFFNGGTSCYNGPQRSVKILMQCGEKNEILDVVEPNMCEYEMRLKTPVVCDEGDLIGEL